MHFLSDANSNEEKLWKPALNPDRLRPPGNHERPIAVMQIVSMKQSKPVASSFGMTILPPGRVRSGNKQENPRAGIRSSGSGLNRNYEANNSLSRIHASGIQPITSVSGSRRLLSRQIPSASRIPKHRKFLQTTITLSPRLGSSSIRCTKVASWGSSWGFNITRHVVGGGNRVARIMHGPDQIAISVLKPAKFFSARPRF